MAPFRNMLNIFVLQISINNVVHCEIMKPVSKQRAEFQINQKEGVFFHCHVERSRNIFKKPLSHPLQRLHR